MTEQNKVKIEFKLNGKTVKTEVLPKLTVLELVRREFRLTSVKEGCGKGECGACTVILNGEPINSCLKLAATLVANDKILTVEGLNDDPIMKKVQDGYVSEGSVQCGFCIPGMALSSYHLLKNNSKPTEHEIKQALSGNICRCTGYKKIVAGVKKASERQE